MANMTNFFGLLEQLQSADITVHQNRCAVVRNRNATCMKCAEVCTSGCISYDDNELIIAPERCIGCGTCATVCPTCALEAHRPNDAELLHSCLAAAKAADGEVIVACEQILAAAEGLFDPDKVVGVTCLGRVEESLLVTLAVAGVKHVSLVQAKCEECEHSTGFRMAELVRDTANTLLETWKSGMRVDLAKKFPSVARLAAEGKGYDASRRGFFASVKDEAKTAAAVTADYAVKDALGVEDAPEPKYVKVMADGTLPHFVPDRRERLLDGLAALGEPEDVMIDTRLWGHVIIDPEKCSSCQMCATFCPTGAISKFKDDDGTFGVQHAPADCVKCRCCTDICPEGALELSEEVFAVDLLSGAVERYEMKPMKNPPGNPHQIWHSMKDLLGCDQVYER
ncbi:4Fe-4S binding protein [Arabiibacter massiliensis]|uniref:4Fe-4S binding protein n=1 Tax=Arabiibacter massiliensis TaxID=1870985 RepID=UPI0009BC436E|nr:4Fe-4S binding protein [Arabiibacter massiliensis]